MTEAWFLAPVAALICGVLALAPLGHQVLARGVVFIDLAVAQAAAAAALWAGALMDHPGWISTQTLAAAGALACAAAVAWLSKKWPAEREARIGLLYVMGASAALLGARLDPHGRERLGELLAADVLWAGWPQVAVLAGCALAVALVGRRLTRDAVFYPVFALVASLAVPTLGLFVVFAALIAPALWQRSGSHRVAAWTAGVLACGVGLGVSWWLDAPSGACVALALSVMGAASILRRRPQPGPAGL
ncbi:MAG: metal ABC transporter permease [Rubrivivax sp.]|nr:metal ABC transporter permease [Rubrivivax sp.]MDP3612114.1 metal ABC transporter permease [Rubrivivax sp.]